MAQTVKNLPAMQEISIQFLGQEDLLEKRMATHARRSKQSIPKKISPEYPLEGLMLKLKLQYFHYLMRRTDSLEKTLMLGKIDGRRSRDDRK